MYECNNIHDILFMRVRPSKEIIYSLDEHFVVLNFLHMNKLL